VELTDEQRHDFDVALNEADLVGVEVDPDARWVGLTLAVLALPQDDGPPPADPRVQLILSPVGRIAASLRHGNWDDADARVKTFTVDRLEKVVARFKQQAIYGWQFLDVPAERDFDCWSDRLSLDWRSEPGGLSHTLDLFQEGDGTHHIDLRIWFDELRIFDHAGHEISLDQFAAAGVRWWEAMRAGDPRTADAGIAPLAPGEEED
jgi:hypothetical protein